jgi:hypothetical protein
MSSKKYIWVQLFPISLNSRPYWIKHNEKGNVGPHLTNEELNECGLSQYKKCYFDEDGEKARNKGNE